MVYQFTNISIVILRELRQKRKLSIQDVASHLGFTRSYVSQIELGKKPLPSYRHLIHWLEYLDIKPKYFEALILDKLKSC